MPAGNSAKDFGRRHDPDPGRREAAHHRLLRCVTVQPCYVTYAQDAEDATWRSTRVDGELPGRSGLTRQGPAMAGHDPVGQTMCVRGETHRKLSKT